MIIKHTHCILQGQTKPELERKCCLIEQNDLITIRKLINIIQFKIWGQDWFESFEINYYFFSIQCFYLIGNNTV